MSKSQHRGTRLIAFALFVVATLPSVARAQPQNQEGSNWGIAVSYVPLSRAHSERQKLLIIDAEEQVEGAEFAIGVARGKTHGGHWTLSYVSKPFKNATFTSVEEYSDSPGGGFTFYNRTTTTTTFTDVKYR